MAPKKSQTPKLFTCDLAAYSDAELNKYLETNGGIVDVEDYENLRKDTVLIQRLRMRARARGLPHSYLIDPDDLTARLEDISADRQALPRSPSQMGSDYRSRDTTGPLDEEEDYRLDLKKETKYYNTLVNEGGRPSHPVSLGRNIIDDPGEYREILSYWWKGENDWQVFESQMGRWREFRRWQRKNREDGRFPKYVEGVKQGLAEHGFTRAFQLDEDPERQDKLTTWIEFLDYEYWWYDKDMRFVKRQQPQYDEAWKELVDSQVLRPNETEEFICNIASAFQHESEEERANKAMEFAKSAVISAQKAFTDPRRSNLSKSEARQRLVAAQSELDAAVKSLESIKRRDDLIYEFYKKTQLSQITKDGKRKRSYQSAKDDAKRRSILLRWILQQIPLIELELNQVKVAENDSNEEDGGKSRKRHPVDDLNQERVLKRRKEDSGNNALSNHKTRASTTQTTSQDSSLTQRPLRTAGHEGQLKRNYYDATGEGRAIKSRRHNGQTSNAAKPVSTGEPGEPLSIQPDSSKADDNTTQVPKPRKRQAKIYQKERESRRIAGHLPQFGMLPKRGEPAPLYAPPSRHPSNIRKPYHSSPRSHASSKKSIAVKAAKSHGISKSRRETKRSKRSKK
ncbi:uncharacterized protein PAC_15539 [Phialocephala subalpina]|uniref:Ankyrin 2,3/unc44 n=1 Tax=Phialocephala subalpina TaxID=576137 RepID=A0A1L7XKS0_9HELO|nr:uncharacterized protein PAC_15539 [Phialocephala subalpina]